MANGKIILKPYGGDPGNQHVGYPENTDIYRWISEDVSDGDVDYIYAPAPDQTYDSVKTQELVSLFYFNGDIPENKIKVLSFKIKYSAKDSITGDQTSEIWFLVSSAATISKTSSKSITDYQSEPEEIALPDEDVQTLNTWLSKAGKGNFPEFSVFVYTINGYNEEKEGGSGDSHDKYTYSEVRLSQLYLEIEYEEVLSIGVHKKVGGEYKAAIGAYRKVDGAWVELTEEEAKSVLKNNTLIRGG